MDKNDKGRISVDLQSMGVTPPLTYSQLCSRFHNRLRLDMNRSLYGTVSFSGSALGNGMPVNEFIEMKDLDVHFQVLPLVCQ